MAVTDFVGRTLLALIFILGGMKLQNLPGAAEHTKKGFDATGLTAFLGSNNIDVSQLVLPLVTIATLMELIGGLLLILPQTQKYGAAILALFLVPVTFIMHWPIVNGEFSQLVAVDLFKNLALLGAMFVILSSRKLKND